MYIEKLNIENYKCFHGKFTLGLNPNVNILVGNNESGKSTILEAINLALTGTINGRYLRNEINPYLFNHQTVLDYVQSLSTSEEKVPPSICIELFLKGEDLAIFKGDGNSKRDKSRCGLVMKIEFDTAYQEEYEALIKQGNLKTVPTEYYHVTWQSFAREAITARSIPLKAALIDSSSTRYQNGSDVYISRIIEADLEDTDKAKISQAYREMREMFGKVEAVEKINERIKSKSKITDKSLSISVDLNTYNSWQTTLMTFLDDIPFHQIGKGEQCIIKTNLALGHKKNRKANLILLEEPENHLSHTRLNQLLANIELECKEKQIIVSTHNSFVANKLGFEKLIFLHDQKSSSFSELTPGTYKYFKKLPGYQTLRLLLCRKAVLVEGPSDELIFQKAYMKENDGKLPIEDGIELISVGLSFKRFLEIAKTVEQPVAVVTDNDGNYEKNIEKKYQAFDDVDCIKICADKDDDSKTLEPQFVSANENNLSVLCDIIGIDYKDFDKKEKITQYMLNNKTDWALHVFESTIEISYPQYITEAVQWCNE